MLRIKTELLRRCAGIIKIKPHLRNNRAFLCEVDRPFAGHVPRQLSHAPSGASVVKLDHRGFVKVTGGQAPDLLQSLITADVHCLDEHCPTSLYTMFLNVQGRVLYDVILYKLSAVGDTSFLLECDANVLGELCQHLRKYKLRKKISVDDVTSEYELYALFDSSSADVSSHISGNHRDSLVCSIIDPRVSLLGSRLVFQHTSTDVSSLFTNVSDSDAEHYHVRRFKLGVPEGVTDLPPGRALPLESNLDLMHGVSFDKGCYLGQELTARSYHVGVTRKRLMPLKTSSNISVSELQSTKVSSSAGERAGVVRNLLNGYGIGIIRMKFNGMDLLTRTVMNEDVILRSSTPEWWPSL